jgi:hypothetical protein
VPGVAPCHQTNNNLSQDIVSPNWDSPHYKGVRVTRQQEAGKQSAVKFCKFFLGENVQRRLTENLAAILATSHR